MWNRRSVQLDIRLPTEIASEAEKVQRTDPEFFNQLIQYGIVRREVFLRLCEDDRQRGSDATGSLLGGLAAGR